MHHAAFLISFRCIRRSSAHSVPLCVHANAPRPHVSPCPYVIESPLTRSLYLPPQRSRCVYYPFSMHYANLLQVYSTWVPSTPVTTGRPHPNQPIVARAGVNHDGELTALADALNAPLAILDGKLGDVRLLHVFHRASSALRGSSPVRLSLCNHAP
ncbi:hypothetical protein B0H11DRAFT_1985906 [Mycena galericulata]|nr:hypothetical protein B0H11DRAFT_1985906 [Mycena galericulata]